MAKSDTKAKASNKKVEKAAKATLDFSDVGEASGFSPKRLEEGDYRAKITKVVRTESKQGNDQFVFTIVPEDHKSAVYPFYCPLSKDSLWKLRNLLVAAGVEVPKGKGAVDATLTVGKVIGITLEDDEYEDKEKSKVMATFPADDVDDASDDEDDEPDEKPAKKAKAKAKEEPAKKGKGKKKKSDDIDL